MIPVKSYILKYKDVTFRHIVQTEPSDKIYIAKRLTLIKVYSGELVTKEDICEICAKIGEVIFIKHGTTNTIKE